MSKTCAFSFCDNEVKGKGIIACKECKEEYKDVFTNYSASKKDPLTVWFQKAMDRIKSRCHTHNRDYSITIEDLYKLFPKDGKCPILKTRYSAGDKISHRNFAPSIDRIDSSKGYVKGNIMMISLLANKMKTDAKPHELIAFAKWVIKTHGIYED